MESERDEKEKEKRRTRKEAMTRDSDESNGRLTGCTIRGASRTHFEVAKLSYVYKSYFSSDFLFDVVASCLPEKMRKTFV